MDLYKVELQKILATKTRKFKEVRANRTGLNIEDWGVILDVLTETFGQILGAGYKIHCPLGTFDPKELNNLYNNPVLKINENTKYKKYRVSFRASEKLKEAVNGFDKDKDKIEISDDND